MSDLTVRSSRMGSPGYRRRTSRLKSKGEVSPGLMVVIIRSNRLVSRALRASSPLGTEVIRGTVVRLS